MAGEWRVHVHAVHPFAIHGDPYFELHVIRADDPENRLLAIRAAAHVFQTPPASERTYTLKFLLGQVTSATEA
jgi:hypothetical protein